LKVDRRLYLNDKGKIVEGQPKDNPVELFRPKGGDVTKADLDKYGKQLEKYVPELQSKKQAEKPQDKMAEKPHDKSADKGPGRPKKKETD
jgi:hypothetical protein